MQITRSRGRAEQARRIRLGSHLPPTSRRSSFTHLAIALAAIFVGAGVGLAGKPAVAMFGLAAVMSLLLALPLSWLPRIAILLTLCIPTDYLPLPTLLIGFPLGFLPFAVWLLRHRPSLATVPLRLLALGLTGWILLSTALAPFHTNRSLLLVATTLVALCGTWLVQPSITDTGIRHYIIVATSWVAAYAVIETFILHSNPLYARLFAEAPNPVRQVWSQYRATSFLGHPLLNGTVFAVVSVLASGEILRRPSAVRVLRMIVLLAAVAATRSRTALVAVAVGLLLVFIFERGVGGIGIRKAGLISIVAVVGAVAGSAYLARASSVEAASSASQRGMVLAQALYDLHQVGITGAGLGEAEVLQLNNGTPSTAPGLENGYAEVLVGLGFGGLILFAALIGGIVVFGLRRRDTVVDAAAIAALAVALAGWKAVDGHDELMLLFAVLSATLLSNVPDSRDALRPAVDLDLDAVRSEPPLDAVTPLRDNL